MARLRSQDYLCSECGYFEDSRLVTIADGDPYTIDGCPLEDCPECQSEAVFVPKFSAPPIMTRALPDGTYRGDRFHVMKEIAKTESAMLDAPVEKRGDFHQHVAKLQTEIQVKGLKDKKH